jgi:hypothetical protein
LPTLLLRAYGRTVTLDGPSAALAAARDRLPQTYRTATTPGERRWEVREHPDDNWAAVVESRVITFRRNLVEAVDAVLSDLELWIAEYSRKWVFVHAGCMTVEGLAILIPGRTMSGKSQLAAALVRAGAQYYSDEYAVLDNWGQVRPYARKPMLRVNGATAATPISVEELGGTVGRGPAPVGLIADLCFDPGVGWRTSALTRGRAVLRLLDNAVAARSRPRAVLAALDGATLHAQALQGTRGDADDAAARLLELVSK